MNGSMIMASQTIASTEASAASAASAASDTTLYENVADRIGALIDRGTLRPGERVPSVRKLSEQMDVSISTVLQAYRVLENRGKIESRPQSGYYVKTRFWRPPAEPEISRPPTTSTKVSLGDMVLRFMQHVAPHDMVPLGAAVPAPELLPMAALNRLAASIARRAPKSAIAYDIPPGNERLRTQVARHMFDAGCELGPDDIVTTSGGQESIGLCLRAVARAGDVIAIESPTYFGTLQLIELLGMKALEIPTHPRDGVCLNAIRRAVDRHAIKACLFISNYQNPLGCCTSEQRKKALLKILAERQIPLIEDDIYGDLPLSGPRPRVCKAFDKHNLVLLCSSFSKTLAPGFRVGWCAPGNRYRQDVIKLKMYSTLATTTVPQMAIAEYLANGGYEHHLRKVRKIYAQNLARLSQLVTEFFPPGTKLTRPAGGFVLWVEMPGGVDSMQLFDRATRLGISIAPGPIFSPKGKYTNFIRLNSALEWNDRVERAIETLGRLVGSS
jgi:DNA-binding transcriptional MocR family regulator